MNHLPSQDVETTQRASRYARWLNASIVPAPGQVTEVATSLNVAELVNDVATIRESLRQNEKVVVGPVTKEEQAFIEASLTDYELARVEFCLRTHRK